MAKKNLNETHFSVPEYLKKTNVTMVFDMCTCTQMGLL